MEERMISYLQAMLDAYTEMKNLGDHYSKTELDFMFAKMIACKEMAESVLRKPVSLKQNGKVEIG